MAKAAAPYIHPRLASVDVRSRQKYSIDLTKLDDDELILFDRLLLKCQVPDGVETVDDLAGKFIDADYDVLPTGGGGGGS